MRVHKIMLLNLCLLFSSTAYSAEGLWASQIQPILEKSGLSKDQYGVEIRNLDGSQVFYSANTNTGFNPASTMKMLVTIVSLEQLGPHYKFATIVKKKDKDLCLVGQGDPSLVYEDLFILTEQLLREPSFAKNVNNIYVDDSFFPTTKQYDDDFDGDSQRSFTAPLSSLSLNYNSVTVFVKPGKVGEKAEVFTEPRSNYFTIINQTKTVKAGQRTTNATVREKGKKIEITVGGQISVQDSGATIYRAIADPSTYAGNIFQDLLQRAGVTVTEGVEHKTCGVEWTEVVRFQSKPLSQILQGMNKFSNNFIAETLMYHLGEAPSSGAGLLKMKTWIKSKKLPEQNVSIDNASGLSRSNSVTPNFLWSLYAYGRNTFQTYPDMMASLPIGGLDGTLRRRFRSTGMQGLVRAKSGSLRNTVSLVGSIKTTQKGELLFVFLFDSKGKSGAQIQYIEEKILEKVAALGGN
ncbi:MAG: D-alanyl-D-alanine carboxypeptidase/D-alanyl-D-alanine-endopeptidase [Bdellovibrionota bacterium]